MSENTHAAEADGHHVDIDHHVKIYVRVFIALMVLTVITVAVANIHMSVPAAIALALFIATVKGSLVACYFMHLIDEKKLIYWLMALAVVFFIFAMFVPVMTESDTIHVGS